MPGYRKVHMTQKSWSRQSGGGPGVVEVIGRSSSSAAWRTEVRSTAPTGHHLRMAGVLVLLLLLFGLTEGRNHENRLIKELNKDYNRHARPIEDVLKPIDVSISFYLTKILGLDEKNQVLTTFGWLEVHWHDDFMVWNASDYGGLTRIIVPPNMIWLPDFGLENSAEAIYDDQADKKFRAGVDHDGWIQWVPGGKFVTSCQLDITLYPFDSQTCEMDFVDWTYDGRYVNLVNGSNSIGLDVYKKHGEWDIISTESLKTDQIFASDPGIPFPTVKFILHLKRKPRFYMINVVAPCLLMSILALLVFYLPPDSGEKVSLGITVLLSFSVFLLLIAENVPKTSDYVPLIGIYLTMVMVMTAFSIVISVIVLDLHHHEPSSPVPRWLRRIAFGFMARLLCMKTPYSTESSSLFQIAHDRLHNSHAAAAHGGHGHHQPVHQAVPPVDINTATVDDLGFDDELLEANNIAGITAVMRGLYDDLESVMAPKKKKPLFEEILQHLRDITTKMKRNIKREQIKEEWKMVAKVIDRFLLIIFLIAIITLTATILYIYPNLAIHLQQRKAGGNSHQ